MTEPAFEVVDVNRVECAFEPARWAFAETHGAAIDAHWTDITGARPQMFNGRVLLQSRGGVERDTAGRPVFRGAYFETDFKAFMAWRDFGHPDTAVRNGFAMAALRGSDGAFVLGEMGQHTANAGRVYFPSGTPDPNDIQGAVVDIEGSARRELAEETGLALDDLVFEPGLTVIHDPVRVCFLKPVLAPEPAERLVGRIEANLARDPAPELARMHIVRREADITPQMPFFVAAYLRRALRAR